MPISQAISSLCIVLTYDRVASAINFMTIGVYVDLRTKRGPGNAGKMNVQ